MNTILNSTSDYHINELDTLGWELTVCNSLALESSPCRKILRQNDSYGNLLYDYLCDIVPMNKITDIIEIGGGYGYLMRDFLQKNASIKTMMLDISPFLVKKQQQTLKDYSVDYITGDFLQTDMAGLGDNGMAILNENLGDFPTLANISKSDFGKTNREGPLRKARDLFDRYSFAEPETESFNMNIGAIEAVEKLCSAGIPYVFLGEHSCEATVPEPYKDIIHVISTGNPEKITLKGHDEYTIKFSFLEKVARIFDYCIKRGPFADFLKLDFNNRIRSIMVSQFDMSDEHEIIRHFVEDLYKYEYLILVKP